MIIKRFTLSFPPESSTKPLTYLLIKNYDIKVNILKAEITAGKKGNLLIEAEGEEDDLNRGLEFLKNENIDVLPLDRQISVDQDSCVHCGACTAVCFSGALTLDRETWRLNVTPANCVVCGLCINACPLKIINIGFGHGVQNE